MSAIKTIAIIGATSEMGSAIARSFSKVPKYRLLLMSDDETRLEELRAELGVYKTEDEVFITTCAREASWEADIIIISTSGADERNVVDKIRDVAIEKIVISTANPIMDAYYKPEKDENTSAAEELQKSLPHSRVVKAFNTMFPGDFASGPVTGKQVDVFIAGNDGAAVETTSELVTRAGFNAIVVGDLAVSRELEQIRVKLILNKLREYDWLGVGRYFTLKR